MMGLLIAIALLGACLCAQTAFAVEVGAKFTKDGNTYKVTEAYKSKKDLGEVTLVKYASSETKAVVNKVTYKGETFEVEAIGKNAFNNAKGHKVVSVKLGKHVDKIGAKAFYDCSKLKTIDLASSDAVDVEKNKKSGKYYVDDLNVGAQAFSKAGKAGVKVKCGSANASYQKVYKSALKSKGLRSDAKMVK
jgi:hypothetical protein